MPTSAFHARYTQNLRGLLDAIPSEAVATFVHTLVDTLQDGHTVFILGNGGSASLASHFACDLGKSLLGKAPRTVNKRPRVISLTDNMATITAWANDEGYEHVFTEQLRSLAAPRDFVIAISASGNSPNVVSALEWARNHGIGTLGLLGKGGGRCLDLCDAAVVVPSDDYGLIEGLHGVLTHEVTSWIMDEMSVDGRVVEGHASGVIEIPSLKQAL